MNRVEELRGARRNYAVAWREFVLSYASHPRRLYCFFEGDDAKYYGIRIDMLITVADRCNLRCNGKDGVLRLFDLVCQDARYKSAWVAFFVDRDFSDAQDISADARFYITPCYSIENLYVKKTAFERVLHDEFGLSRSGQGNSDMATITNLYEKRLGEFNQATEELNAWLYIQCRTRKRTPHRKLHIDSVPRRRLFSVGLNKVEKRYSLNSLLDLFPEANPVCKHEVAAQVAAFRGLDAVECFRGKFLLYFLRVFVMKLKEDRVSQTQRFFSHRGTVRLNLTGSNVLSELSQYADTPDCLRDFLSERAAVRPA